MSKKKPRRYGNQGKPYRLGDYPLRSHDGVTGESREKNCIICNQGLGITGGMGGTGMCGPCCTGDHMTLEERGETW